MDRDLLDWIESKPEHINLIALVAQKCRMAHNGTIGIEIEVNMHQGNISHNAKVTDIVSLK